jgi:hypothetical protein
MDSADHIQRIGSRRSSAAIHFGSAYNNYFLSLPTNISARRENQERRHPSTRSWSLAGFGTRFASRSSSGGKFI